MTFRRSVDSFHPVSSTFVAVSMTSELLATRLRPIRPHTSWLEAWAQHDAMERGHLWPSNNVHNVVYVVNHGKSGLVMSLEGSAAKKQAVSIELWAFPKA